MKKVIFVFFIALALSHIANAQNNNENSSLQPNIKASINGKITGAISINELLNNNIIVSLKSSVVASFTLSFATEDGNVIEIPFTGNKITLLSDSIKIKLIKAKKLSLKNIKAQDQSGKSYIVNSLIFTIKK